MKSSLIKIEYAVRQQQFIDLYIYTYMLFSLYMRVPNFYNARTRALDMLVNHVYYIIFIFIYTTVSHTCQPAMIPPRVSREGSRCEL